MSDLISRKEAIKVVDDLKITIEPDVIEEYTLYQVLAILVKKIESNLVDRINKIPTIEAVPVVHGEWRKTCTPDVFQCSHCKKAVKMDMLCSSEFLREFCPKCGADMRKDGE